MDLSQITLVVQGKFCSISLPKIKDYSKKYKVVYSTWLDENTDSLKKELEESGILLIAKKEPKLDIEAKNGTYKAMKTGNVIYQIDGMLNGLEAVNTKYCLRLRTDEFYTNLEQVIERFFKEDEKLFTSNIFFRKPEVFTWHISDHIMIAKTVKMKKMYNLARETVLNQGCVPIRFKKRLKDSTFKAKDSDALSFTKDNRLQDQQWTEGVFGYCLKPPEVVLGSSWILANTQEMLDESECYEIMYRHFGIFDCNKLSPLMWTWTEMISGKNIRRYNKKWVNGPTPYSANCTINDDEHFKNLVLQRRKLKKIMENPSSVRIKVFIVTYKANELLVRCIKSLLESDLVKFDYQINVINNFDKINFPGNENKRLKVYNNTLRPDFSTGHLSRNWNQAIINGFKDLKNPDSDIVVCIQSDEAVKENWVKNLLLIHQNYNFVTSGGGDSFHSYTPEAVKKVGLWDERFCNIGFQESDYFLRHLIHNTDGCSINDYYHSRVHNPFSDLKFNKLLLMPENRKVEILKNSESGFLRKDESHMKSLEHHHASFLHFRKKWGLSEDYNNSLALNFDMVPPESWPVFNYVEDQHGRHVRSVKDSERFTPGVDPGFIKSVFCKNPQNVMYPYFEKDIKKLHDKSYVFTPVYDMKNRDSLLNGVYPCDDSSLLLKEEYWSNFNALEDAKTQIIEKCPIWPHIFPHPKNKSHGVVFKDTEFNKSDSEKVIKVMKSTKILCVGLGSGISLAPFSNFCDNIYALDLTQDNIDKTKKYCVDAGVDNLNVEKLENLDFKLEKNSFDTILVYQFLEYIPSRTIRLQVLKNLKALLKINGRLIIQRGYGKIKNSAFDAVHYFEEIHNPEKPLAVLEDDWSYLPSDIIRDVSLVPQDIDWRCYSRGYANNHYVLPAPINSPFQKWIVSNYIKKDLK